MKTSERRTAAVAGRSEILAGFISKQGDLVKAKTMWLEVYDLNVDATGSPNADFGGVCTCGYLGRWYSEQGDEEQAEQYLRLAFEGYLETAGRDSSGVRRYLEKSRG